MRASRIPICLLVLLTLSQVSVAGTIDARLRYLQITGKLSAYESLPISIRFESAPDASQLAAIEAAGARLRPAPVSGREVGAHRLGARTVLGSRTVLPAGIDPARLEALATVDGVARIETAWSPTRVAPLYRTRDLCGAEDAWQLGAGPAGWRLGEGVTIADLDSGVDVFHPDLWFAEGDLVHWIDADQSGGWSAGDGVDVNDNGSIEIDENLEWLDAPGNAPGMSTSLQVPIDHFYRDLDGDGERDFGPGFVESDPTYGEPVYRVVDTNGNDLLDPGEQLIGLSRCKVRAVYETDATIRRAGVDLILSEGDPYGHGTQVQSIHAGGEPGRRFAGLAPGAELLAGNIMYGDDFVFTPLEDRMTWAVSEGADVIVHEIGGWVWEFLDGSSNVEVMINELAADGVMQVVPAGNLAAGGHHWEGDLGGSVGDSLTAQLVSASPSSPITTITGNFYYRPQIGDAVTAELETLDGDVVTLGGLGSIQTVGDFDVYTIADLSSRGTARFDFEITLAAGSSRTSLDGTWTFRVRRAGVAKRANPLRVHVMSVDDQSSWFGNSTWVGAVSSSTVTWPATADSAITVAAYNPASGALNGFSGRGPRVDGMAILDVAAPGSLTYTAFRSQDRDDVAGGYGAFGGTSAAGPHVVASVALLLQWEPSATSGRIRELLRAGAVADAQTGAIPNDNWGFGKLNVHASLLDAVTAIPPAAEAATAVRIEDATPNPFNPEVTVRYRLERQGSVVARIFDLRGRRVRVESLGVRASGSHELRWNGLDDQGRSVSSGVYLVQIEVDGTAAVRKVALVK